MIKRQPSGYTATCKCGKIVGGIVIAGIERSHLVELLGEWVLNGKKVEPKFGAFQVGLMACRCRKELAK